MDTRIRRAKRAAGVRDRRAVFLPSEGEEDSEDEGGLLERRRGRRGYDEDEEGEDEVSFFFLSSCLCRCR